MALVFTTLVLSLASLENQNQGAFWKTLAQVLVCVLDRGSILWRTIASVSVLPSAQEPWADDVVVNYART